MGIRRIDRIRESHFRESCGGRIREMKGMMKVFSCGVDVDIFKEWRVVGVLKGYKRGSVWKVIQCGNHKEHGLIL